MLRTNHIAVALDLCLFPSPAPASSWSAEALDAALRPVVINTLTDRYIAGAAVSVVKDGRMVYAAGFGDREVYSETPVVAERTVWRIGSVTKVLTAIAVLQLVDRGEVQLDDPVARHVEAVDIPDRYDEPIRVRHLLTHTAGFDQLGYGRHASSREEVLPLVEFLRDDLVQVRPPGRLAVYDTYGITLAGLLVEQVSGLGYGNYLRTQIFDPLGMERTGIEVPRAADGEVAIGYGFAGEWEAMPWEWMNTPPASSVNSTVTDMAQLMIALLSSGGDRPGLLRPQTLASMLRVQHRNHDALPGFAYGLWEDRRNGRRGLSHGGSMEGFACLLYLLPSERLGVFVAYNQESRRLGDAVVEAVLDRLPAADPPAESTPVRSSALDPTELAGTYRSAMRNHTRPEHGGWTADPMEATASGDGSVEFGGTRFHPTAGAYLESTDGRRLTVRRKADGAITHLLVDQRVFDAVIEAP